MQIHQRQQEDWAAQSKKLASNWRTIQASRRVEIHIPSLSVDAGVRQRMPHQKLQENLQFARLCAVEDPLVEVIYVSPFALADAVSAYYSKLIEVSKRYHGSD